MKKALAHSLQISNFLVFFLYCSTINCTRMSIFLIVLFKSGKLKAKLIEILSMLR